MPISMMHPQGINHNIRLANLGPKFLLIIIIIIIIIIIYFLFWDLGLGLE